MGNSISTVIDTIKEIVGGFTQSEMIAIGAACGLALLLGFFIGAISFYGAGVKIGKKKEINKSKNALALKMKELETEMEEEIKKVLNEIEEKRKEQETVLIEEEKKLAAKAIKENDSKCDIAVADTTDANKEELGQCECKEEPKAAVSGYAETKIKERKKKITLLNKQEILEYADGLNEYLPANIYERGGEKLPDSCRVGICTFMLVYERKGMVKIVLRLHKKTAAALEAQYKLFSKAISPKGNDWYKWILNSEVDNLNVVTAAIRMAYKYTYLTNYDDKTKEINVAYANASEAKLNASVLKHQNIEDREFVVASDNVEGAEYYLYGKNEMGEYVSTFTGRILPKVNYAKNEISPNTFKIEDKTFAMAYEKDGIAKIVFRASEAYFKELQEKFKQIAISNFPKASTYDWYVAIIDSSFTENAQIEEILQTSYNFMLEKYYPEKNSD